MASCVSNRAGTPKCGVFGTQAWQSRINVGHPDLFRSDGEKPATDNTHPQDRSARYFLFWGRFVAKDKVSGVFLRALTAGLSWVCGP